MITTTYLSRNRGYRTLKNFKILFFNALSFVLTDRLFYRHCSSLPFGSVSRVFFFKTPDISCSTKTYVYRPICPNYFPVRFCTGNTCCVLDTIRIICYYSRSYSCMILYAYKTHTRGFQDNWKCPLAPRISSQFEFYSCCTKTMLNYVRFIIGHPSNCVLNPF